jgi:hypothetical protein|tara:strand:+ start:24 stop:266 length:243 start_codon:yes stop_codon:yes gene_type:complete
MNDKCDIENGLSFRKTTGRYYNEATFVDIPLTPSKENRWKTKLKNMRDALVDGTMQSSVYVPITATKKSQKGRCDNCIIS